MIDIHCASSFIILFYLMVEFKNGHKRNIGVKRRFLLFGIINVLITNIFLQALLLVMRISLATLLSQLLNLCLGFVLYGKLVFRVKRLNIRSALLYLSLASFIWILNWSAISLLVNLGFYPNFSAAIVLPLLAAISYAFQKLLIFKIKD